MKTTLEFDLNDEDDRKRHLLYIQAPNLAIILSEFERRLYGLKYNLINVFILEKTCQELAEKLHDGLLEELQHHHIDLDELLRKKNEL